MEEAQEVKRLRAQVRLLRNRLQRLIRESPGGNCIDEEYEQTTGDNPDFSLRKYQAALGAGNEALGKAGKKEI